MLNLALGVLLAAPPVAIIARHDADDERLLAEARPYTAVAPIGRQGQCTLIAPRWALTAAHVAASLPTGQTRLRFGDRDYLVERVVIHPQGHAQPGRPPEVDLALLRLDRDVEGVAPLPLYRAADEQGKTILVVGAGDVGDGRAAPKAGDGHRRAGRNIVDDAGPKRLFFRFDAPPEGVELEAVSGPGDSGGPALIQSESAASVAGVSSGSAEGQPGRYGVVEVYTRVSSYADWIDAELRK
jgi:hypothetical protein